MLVMGNLNSKNKNNAVEKEVKCYSIDKNTFDIEKDELIR